MIPVLILAAGSSSRMRGRDKLLEPIDGTPQLRRLAKAAIALGNRVFVALPSKDHPRAAAIEDLNLTILEIPHATEGLGATLREAVASLPPCTHFMVTLGDLVAIDTQDMRTLLTSVITAPDAPIVRGATKDGKAGHPIVFNANLRKWFAKLCGDDGANELTETLIDQTVFVSLPGNRARLDLDTPEDWAAYRATL